MTASGYASLIAPACVQVGVQTCPASFAADSRFAFESWPKALGLGLAECGAAGDRSLLFGVMLDALMMTSTDVGIVMLKGA